MEGRIETVTKLGNIPKDIAKHEQFTKWSPKILPHDHHTLLNVEFRGTDGFEGPLYVGSGCFHRRESLCGRRYSKDYKAQWTNKFKRTAGESIGELEEKVKNLADCNYEENTQGGKQMGLKYGCLVEDVITGLSIQCRGWKSIYFTPSEEGFLPYSAGAITCSAQEMGRSSIWGDKHRLQLGYCYYNLWAINSMPTLFYVVVPSLYLSSGVSFFPKPVWFIPFAYVTLANYTYSLCEMLWCGKTLKTWWNYQRMTFFGRTRSYLFTIIDTVLRLLGFSKSVFVATAKVADKEVSKRYQQEVMEFGSSSPMFTVIAAIAQINLLSLGGTVARVVMHGKKMDFEALTLQFLLCCYLVIINTIVYEAMFIRRDKGRLPAFLTFTSLALFFAHGMKALWKSSKTKLLFNKQSMTSR